MSVERTEREPDCVHTISSFHSIPLSFKDPEMKTRKQMESVNYVIKIRGKHEKIAFAPDG